MTLMRDENHTRKRCLIELLNELTAALRGLAEGVIVVGSLGYNWDGHVFTTSDLDLMVVGDRDAFGTAMAAAGVAAEVPAVAAAAHLYARGDVDFVSLKATRSGILFTLHYLDEPLLTRLCEFRAGTFTSFRARPKVETVRLYTFDGSFIEHELANQPLPEGWRHEVPASVERDGAWFVGVLHGRLLHQPRVHLDRNGRLVNHLEAIWEAFIRRLARQVGSPVDLTRTNPLKALANARHFEPAVAHDVLARTRHTLDAMHIPYLS